MSWQCTYCLQWSDANTKHGSVDITENADDISSIGVHSTICKNMKCRRPTIIVSVCGMVPYRAVSSGMGKKIGTFRRQSIAPTSFSKPQPSYVPQVIVTDYNEACAIIELSPKASATLSRRCLQGIIRDFFGISKGTLNQEILAIKDQVDADVWDAIDSVRSLGNIGAHMEKDVNIIVDIEADEAKLMISIIERLFKEWYVARYERQQRVAAIKSLAQEKAEQKNNTSVSGNA